MALFTLPVQWLRSKIAGRRPGDGVMRPLLDGEPFINQADATLCWLDAAGALRATPLADLAQLGSPVFRGVPTAPLAALGDNSSTLATTSFVVRAIAALVNGSPAQLDTIRELADALGDDANYAATVTAALALRLRLDAAQGLTAAQQAQGLANLGAQAALGYPPARESIVFETQGGNGTPLQGAGQFTEVAGVNFVSNAVKLSLTAFLLIYNTTANQGQAYAYLRIIDLTTGAVFDGSVSNGANILPNNSLAGTLSLNLASYGLTLGHTYRAQLLACTTGGFYVYVNSTGLSGVNL